MCVCSPVLYAEEFKGFVFLFTAPLKIMCNGPLMIAGIKICSVDREKGRHARRNANKVIHKASSE